MHTSRSTSSGASGFIGLVPGAALLPVTEHERRWLLERHRGQHETNHTGKEDKRCELIASRTADALLNPRGAVERGAYLQPIELQGADNATIQRCADFVTGEEPRQVVPLRT
jgi:hypothetical protein